MIADLSARLNRSAERALSRWSIPEAVPGPALLRQQTIRLRGRLGDGIPGADDRRQFERTLQKLIARGTTELRPRDDIVLAARFTSKAGLLGGLSLAESPRLLGAVLDRWDRLKPDGLLAPLLWHSVFQGYFVASDDQTRDQMRRYLVARLPALASNRMPPTWLPVVEAHQDVLGESPAEPYVAGWFSGDAHALEELRAHAGIPTTSWFWGCWVDTVLATLVGLGDDGFQLHLGRALEMAGQWPQRRDDILAAVLERYARLSAPQLHDELLARVVDAWGSPHLDLSGLSHRWSNVSEEAVGLICHWLAEEDLADFFELIRTSSRTLSTMDQRRFAYWKRFTQGMRYTRLVLGTGFRWTRNPDVRKFIDKRSQRIAWLQGSTKDNIAILMKIGDCWFVEFGETGNACYPYRDEHRPFDLNRKEHARTELASQSAVSASRLDRMIHQRDWEADFDAVLARLDIWPDAIARERIGVPRPLPKSPPATNNAAFPGPQPRMETSQGRPSAHKSAIFLAIAAMNLPGDVARELNSLMTGVVDNRAKRGSYWLELNGRPSDRLIAVLKACGFRYANPRGFYR